MTMSLVLMRKSNQEDCRQLDAKEEGGWYQFFLIPSMTKSTTDATVTHNRTAATVDPDDSIRIIKK